MATIAELNAKLGLRVEGFQKALKQVERDMQRTSRRFSAIGNELSMSLSLPLAAIGFKALQAAGDIERLKIAITTTMTDAGYSIGQATAELEELRKAALAPGLDLEQAVKASIRLQNVGLSAEKARDWIKELANTISMGTGTAENLDLFTIQLSQMIGKGKVMAQDLRSMIENMPKLATILKDAFGTSNAEALRDMGVTIEKFMEATLTGMQKLERVPGGLSNAFINFAMSVKLALASLGDEIDSTFDIRGNLDKFALWIGRVVEGFKNLSDGTQKTIVYFASFIVVLGPALKVLGAIFGLSGLLVNAFKNLGAALLFIVKLPITGPLFASKLYTQVGLAIAALTENFKFYLAANTAGIANMSRVRIALLSLTAAWKTMDTAIKTTVIGLAITGVIALGLAINSLSKSMSTAGKVQSALNEIQNEAEQNIIAERLEVGRLTEILNSNTASYTSKKDALDKLKAISSEHFGSLSMEKLLVDDVTTANKNYTKSILEAAKAQAARAKLVELEGKKLDLLSKISIAPSGAFAALRTSNLISQIKSIDEQQKAIAKSLAPSMFAGMDAAMAKGQAGIDAVGTKVRELREIMAKGGAKEGGEGGKDKIKSVADILKEVDKALADINVKQVAFGAGFDGPKEKADVLKKAIEELIEKGQAIDSKSVSGLITKYNDLTGVVKSAATNALPMLGAATVKSVGTSTKAVDDLNKKIRDEMPAAVAAAIEKMGLYMEEIETTLSPSDELAQKWKDFSTSMADVIETGVEDTLISAGEAIGGLLSGAINAKGAMVHMLMPILNMLENLGKLAIATGISIDGIKKAFKLHPVAAIIGGVALIAITKMVKSKLANSVPKFAEGGMVDSPTMAMFGEYPGAKQNPEFALRKDQLMDLVAQGGGGQNVHLTGDVRWNGREFVIAFEQAQKDLFRSRGR